MQMVSITETSIIITICKIVNCEDIQSSRDFQIYIYSAKTGSLILSKPIKSKFCQNQIIFNYSLKISYPSDQNQILIKLLHYNKMTISMNAVTQFTLNLDNLKTKKMQFFPFGKNDKIIKIALGEQQRSQVLPKANFKSQDQYFVRQKEEFLRKIMKNSSTTRHDNSLSNKPFSQKAFSLLSEVKSMRQSKNTQKNHIEEEFRNYYKDENKVANLKINFKQPKRAIKSHSERLFLHSKTHRTNTNTHLQQEQYQRSSNKSQKHKLALKSLEMLACENEYYQQGQQNYYNDYGNRRTSMMTSKKTPNSKRLINSQFY